MFKMTAPLTKSFVFCSGASYCINWSYFIFLYEIFQIENKWKVMAVKELLVVLMETRPAHSQWDKRF